MDINIILKFYIVIISIRVVKESFFMIAQTLNIYMYSLHLKKIEYKILLLGLNFL